MRAIRSVITLSLCLINFLFGQTNLQDKIQTTIVSAPISVTIGGNFVVNGTYSASANERVDQFITRMFALGRSQLISTVNPQSPDYEYRVAALMREIEKYPRRDITLRRANGEILKLDLEKFRLTGDFSHNPYLKNDDVLIFPTYDEFKDFIRIEGAVNKPGKFQFMEGDKVEDAIILAHGLDPAYENIKEMEIYRLTYEGELDTILRLTFDPKFKLQRGDRVRILGIAPQKNDYTAYIAGEVNQPGTIILPKNGLPLREAFKQVGGIRETADLSRTELIRGANAFRSIFFSEQFEELMMRRMANIKEEDSLNFVIDNKLRFSRGVAAYDFTKLKSEIVDPETLIVRDGDYIFVPPKIELVYVFGQVNNFGYVKYVPGKDYHYYIQQAGGLGQTAKDEIYLIKGKSRAWIKLNDKEKVEIEPGDFIWVPKKPIRDFDYYVQRVGFVGSIVTGIMTTLILLLKK
ncbi:MAG: SLBB domain-containing protein [Ignavibacteria bacterium]|jgi:protein involved in polysaccharide export with SLBB domain|nr:SLBB domain-containing protein [Ignavibacteria bacterium]MDH7527391.1 SLBB domain-containing protein [Ignavibacteria bacterium]